MRLPPTGVRLRTRSSVRGLPDLVYLTGSLSHVDVRWEQPSGARFLEQLASFARLIIFDRRGVGASDRLPSNAVPTSEEWALDLEVVLDATDSQSAALMAVVDGGGMAITFASELSRASECVGAVEHVGDLDLSRRHRFHCRGARASLGNA